MGLSISGKVGFVFGAILLLSAGTGYVGYHETTKVGDYGLEVGTGLAPLAEAAKEIELTATRAHLIFEEIASGDANESIDEVWGLLDETMFFANAILDGGTRDGVTYLPTASPDVRAKMLDTRAKIETFIRVARERHATLNSGDVAPAARRTKPSTAPSKPSSTPPERPASCCTARSMPAPPRSAPPSPRPDICSRPAAC
ncbi:hypothetical protein [Methylobrevis pamukkalensis]|uniref:Chemotaxis methyl-accepting receptor HlyB-like 4HB MCP domain-containing protein n=1 Tax=Methylobrevis pamukkalensis TaxID=1439726 RepID=A0A1E3GZC4_9HYPH|nr:hypothetical protein [Methylobrevis pamukkalensis]ODN69275.1 hypothetical protein A6302_03433 [Methylobrevis pamukkalensis]